MGIIKEDMVSRNMSVRTQTSAQTEPNQVASGNLEVTAVEDVDESTSLLTRAKEYGLRTTGYEAVDTKRGVVVDEDGEVHRMGQMGAKRIGSLAIGIGVVGIVLNQMSNMDIVSNSTGVIDVANIFQTAGSGLNLLVVGVIIAAAAVLLSLWSGF